MVRTRLPVSSYARRPPCNRFRHEVWARTIVSGLYRNLQVYQVVGILSWHVGEWREHPERMEDPFRFRHDSTDRRAPSNLFRHGYDLQVDKGWQHSPPSSSKYPWKQQIRVTVFRCGIVEKPLPCQFERRFT